MDATGEWQCKPARGTPDACTPVSHHRRPCCWRSHGFGERSLSGSPPGRRAGTGLDVCRHPFLSPIDAARAGPRGRRRRGRRAARANQVPQSPRHAPLAEGGRGDRGEIRRARALEPAARRQQGTRLIRQQGTRNSARPYAVVPRGRPRNHRRPPRALSLSSLSWPRSPPSAASHASW